MDPILLSAFVDDEVTAAERAEVGTHLTGCSDCRAELRRLQETALMASLLPELLPPSDLRMRILDRTTRRRSPWERVREWVARPAVWSPALAAGAVGIMLASMHGSPRPMHMAQGIRPVDVATSPGPSPARRAVDDVDHVLHVAKDRAREIYDQLHQSFGGIPVGGSDESQLAARPVTTGAVGPDWRPAVLAVRPGSSHEKAHRVAALHPGAGRPPAARSFVRAVRAATPAGAHPRRSSPDLIIPDAPPSKPMSDMPPSSGDMAALNPPMGGMPDMPKTVESPAAPSPPARPDDRPHNLIAAEFTKLADTRPSQQRSTDEIVQELNASALSASREVQWKFARIKF